MSKRGERRDRAARARWKAVAHDVMLWLEYQSTTTDHLMKTHAMSEEDVVSALARVRDMTGYHGCLPPYSLKRLLEIIEQKDGLIQDRSFGSDWHIEHNPGYYDPGFWDRIGRLDRW